jgi:Fe-S-cluster containining protein
MKPDQECLQCGRCCERWGWGQEGVPDDLIPWLENNRQDILQHVTIKMNDGTSISGRSISIDALPRVTRVRYWQDQDGTGLRRCPFFQRSDDGRSWCRIHDAKPQVCREFTPWKWKNLEYYGSCPACRDKAP